MKGQRGGPAWEQRGRTPRDDVPAVGWRKGRRKAGKKEDEAEEEGEAESSIDTCGSSGTCGCVIEKSWMIWASTFHGRPVWGFHLPAFLNCCSLACVIPTGCFPVPSLIWASLLLLPNSVQTHSTVLGNTIIPPKPLLSSFSMSSKLSSMSQPFRKDLHYPKEALETDCHDVKSHKGA